MLAVCQSISVIVILAYLFYYSWAGLLVLSPVGFCYYGMCQKEYRNRACREFENQFKEALRSLITALNVGYSIENALREVPKEMKILYGKEAAIVREVSYIVRQLEMNIPVERALQEFAVRVDVEDVQTFVTVFVITKRNGGDMIAILQNTIKKICMKIEVTQEIQTMIAAKKLEFRIMAVIPVGIIIYMKWCFPEFMSVLYGNICGGMIMTICLAMYITAYCLGKKMLKIEV